MRRLLRQLFLVPLLTLLIMVAPTGMWGRADATPVCNAHCHHVHHVRHEQVIWDLSVLQTQIRMIAGTIHRNDPHQTCVRGHESANVRPSPYVATNGNHWGAYQDDRSTWDWAAQASGRPDLVGANILAVVWYDQENVNWTLYLARGDQPWGGRCN